MSRAITFTDYNNNCLVGAYIRQLKKGSAKVGLVDNHKDTEKCQLDAGYSVDGILVDCILFPSKPNEHFPN